jgi:hypothetical protein
MQINPIGNQSALTTESFIQGNATRSSDAQRQLMYYQSGRLYGHGPRGTSLQNFSFLREGDARGGSNGAPVENLASEHLQTRSGHWTATRLRRSATAVFDEQLEPNPRYSAATTTTTTTTTLPLSQKSTSSISVGEECSPSTSIYTCAGERLTDPALVAGSLGLYGRSNLESPLTVQSFPDLTPNATTHQHFAHMGYNYLPPRPRHMGMMGGSVPRNWSGISVSSSSWERNSTSASSLNWAPRDRPFSLPQSLDSDAPDDREFNSDKTGGGIPIASSVVQEGVVAVPTYLQRRVTEEETDFD